MRQTQGGRIFILLGIFTGLVAAGAVFIAIQPSRASAQPQVPTTSVVIALKEIPEYTLVPSDAVTIKKLPVDAVQPGMAKDPKTVVGRFATMRIFPGEPILDVKLADTDGGSGLTFALPKGKVVVSFPAPPIVETGAVRAGDKVDLIFTIEMGDSSSTVVGQTTQFTVQNLQILGTVPVTESSTKKSKTPDPSKSAREEPLGKLLLFAVEPQQALVLKALENSEGINELALRAAGDDTKWQTEAITADYLISTFKLKAPTKLFGSAVLANSSSGGAQASQPTGR